MLPTPPIVVTEGWDAKIYDSVHDAELDLESVDVNEGVYKAYDSEGRRLGFETEGEAVHIISLESIPTGEQDLKDLLNGLLVQGGVAPDPEADLQRLLELCSPYRFKVPRSGWEVLKGLFRSK